MTKEQFWRIIEDVNAVSQNHDQETVWTRIVENLSHYPLEDIMDWHLIYHEYKDEAYRDEMFAVSTALGSDYADEGLNNFSGMVNFLRERSIYERSSRTRYFGGFPKKGWVLQLRKI